MLLHCDECLLRQHASRHPKEMHYHKCHLMGGARRVQIAPDLGLSLDEGYPIERCEALRVAEDPVLCLDGDRTVWLNKKPTLRGIA